MLLWLVFFALFILCSGISIIFLVYIFIIWYASFASQPISSDYSNDHQPAHKRVKKGLTMTELEMLPGVLEGGGGVARGVECAVCLDSIEEGQPARVLPECGHVFHRGCADAWLTANAECPMCRTRLLPPAAVAPALLPPPPPEVGVV